MICRAHLCRRSAPRPAARPLRERPGSLVTTGLLLAFLLGPSLRGGEANAGDFSHLREWSPPAARPSADWLINPQPFQAQVLRKTPDELVLANGLISRSFRLAPNAATVGLDNLVTGEAILRGVKPEAILDIDGKRYDVGGL